MRYAWLYNCSINERLITKWRNSVAICSSQYLPILLAVNHAISVNESLVRTTVIRVEDNLLSIRIGTIKNIQDGTAFNMHDLKLTTGVEIRHFGDSLSVQSLSKLSRELIPQTRAIMLWNTVYQLFKYLMSWVYCIKHIWNHSIYTALLLNANAEHFSINKKEIQLLQVTLSSLSWWCIDTARNHPVNRPGTQPVGLQVQ